MNQDKETLLSESKPFPVIKLKSGKDRAVIHRHPWIFSGAIHEPDFRISEGTIVEIQSASDEPLAWGHWSGGRNASVVCRLFEFAPFPKNFIRTDDYWLEKFRSAYLLRKSLIMNEKTTDMYRLINGEGDGLPGMIVDIYPSLAVIQLRNAGMKRLQNILVRFLKEELSIHSVLLKEEKDHSDDEFPGKWLTEPMSGELIGIENGLKFEVQPSEGQKTGFFLDQRESRRLAGSLAAGKKVLNAFCYTGGFSVYALAGGAEEVISVDISAAAIRLCSRNIDLNNSEYKQPHHREEITADCFEYLRHIREDYFDMIILDPPAFTKHIKTVTQASRGYKDINLKAINKIKKGGILMTYSCSQHISTDLFQKIIFGAAADSGRTVRIISKISHAFDHPINIYHPEGEYLKGLILSVE